MEKSEAERNGGVKMEESKQTDTDRIKHLESVNRALNRDIEWLKGKIEMDDKAKKDAKKSVVNGALVIIMMIVGLIGWSAILYFCIANFSPFPAVMVLFVLSWLWSWICYVPLRKIDNKQKENTK
ncbi:MAG TPA: hypothetical protein VGI03_07925 [Verrucomicrobiae bacterium]|jgi:hypothetical protein